MTSYVLIAAIVMVCMAIIFEYRSAIKFLIKGKIPEARIVAGLIYDGLWNKIDYIQGIKEYE